MGRLQRTAAKRSEVCDVRPRTREIILNKSSFPGPNEPKYFEDYPEGASFELGSVVVDETECVEIGRSSLICTPTTRSVFMSTLRQLKNRFMAA